MTIKLYDLDAYQSEFEANVLECNKVDDRYVVVLDQTLFFPEEGGQTCDRGMINDIEVKDVQIINQVIYHYLDKPVSGKVKGKIDFNYRYNNMQNHSGEHVLSGLVKSMYNFDNCGFHLSDNEITTDYNGYLDDNALKELESKANEIILNNYPIISFYPDDIENFQYRSKKVINEAIRLVEIENVDCCACCAPHVSSTSEIGIIKILKAMKYKGGTRLFFVCGNRAYLDYQVKHEQASYISKQLSLPPDNLVIGVNRLLEENNSLKQEISSLKKQLIDIQVKDCMIEDYHIIFYQDGDRTIQQYHLNKLLPLAKRFVGIFIGDNDHYTFMISSKDDSTLILKELKNSFNIRGGGKKDLIQGQIDGNKEDIIKVLKNI